MRFFGFLGNVLNIKAELYLDRGHVAIILKVAIILGSTINSSRNNILNDRRITSYVILKKGVAVSLLTLANIFNNSQNARQNLIYHVYF